MSTTVTADEFEQQYAAKSWISVERLRALGGVVRPCRCEQDGCKGWQMFFDKVGEGHLGIIVHSPPQWDPIHE